MHILSLKKILLVALVAAAFNGVSNASLPGDHNSELEPEFKSNKVIPADNSAIDPEEALTVHINGRIVAFLKNEQRTFAERLFNHTPGECASPIMPAVVDDHCRKVIFNRTGYLELEIQPIRDYSIASISTGNAERLYAENLKRWEGKTKLGARIHHSSPIGYNIYLPLTTPKAILVEVYGGGEIHKYYTKVLLSNYHQILLSRGIVIITLNMVDILEFGGHRSEQLKMPEQVYTKVQNSINAFYAAFKASPESIDPELSGLNNLSIYLSGCSFGGLTTIYQAKLFPHTFDGYISHSGGLGKDKPGWYFNRSKSDYLSDVSKEDEIAKIAKPILILHNRNDSIVNIEESNDWAIKARKVLGAHAKIQVFYTSRLNPHDANKAHGDPIEEIAFRQYVDTVSQFILSGPSEVPSLTEWRLCTQALYADKFRRLSTPEEKFLHVAFRFYRTHLHEADLQEADGVLPTTIGFGCREAQLASWKKYYEPLFYVIHYFEQAIRLPDRKVIETDSSYVSRLGLTCMSELELCGWDDAVKTQLNINKLQNTLKMASDESVKKTLRVVLPLYLGYLHRHRDGANKLEAYMLNLNKLGLEKLLTPVLIEAFRLHLGNAQKKSLNPPSYRAKYLMVISHFMANPELLADKYVEIESMPGFHEGLSQAKIAFEKAVQLDRLMTRTVLRDCLKLAVRQVKADNVARKGAGDK